MVSFRYEVYPLDGTYRGDSGSQGVVEKRMTRKTP